MGIKAACILPHSPAIASEDGADESPFAATIDSMAKVARWISEMDPDTIVVVSPHAPSYSNYFLLSSGGGARGFLGIPKSVKGRLSEALLAIKPSLFADEVIDVEYDEELVREIVSQAKGMNVLAGTAGQKTRTLDVGVTVPLHFIKKCCPGKKIVRCATSGLPMVEHYRLGKCIQKAACSIDRNVVVIASADLSHRHGQTEGFGYAPESETFDNLIVDALVKADFLEILKVDGRISERVGECGCRAIAVLAGALDKANASSSVLTYEHPYGIGSVVVSFRNSGTNGSRRFDRAFHEYQKRKIGEIRKKETVPVKMARFVLEKYVRTDAEATSDDPEIVAFMDNAKEIDWKSQGSVFVSFRIDGRLRGSYGWVEPKKETLIEEFLYNVLGAAYEDPRFDSVSSDELEKLTYEVDFLVQAEKIDTPKEIDPQRHGVNAYTPKRKKQGYVLPDMLNLKPGQELVEIALKKGSIDLLEQYDIERITTRKYC